MAYRIEHGECVEHSIRRIAAEQLDRALADLREAIEADPAEAIHDCRKRCKKYRGLIRLVRPALGDQYRIANDLARDAARELSGLRDATAVHQSFEMFLAASDPLVTVDADALERISTDLREQHDRIVAGIRPDDAAVTAAIALLDEARAHAATLTVEGHGWQAIGPGITRIFDQGDDALTASIDDPSGDNFHDWRKRVKYLWYDVRLLTPIAPSILNPLRASLKQLAETLGDAHDVAVLGGQLADRRCGEADDFTSLTALVDDARRELEWRAVGLGLRLYAESPKRFARRLGTYWDTWADHGAEPDQRGLDELLDEFAATAVDRSSSPG